MSATRSAKPVEFLILQDELTQDMTHEVLGPLAEIRGEEYKYPIPATFAIPRKKYDWIKRFPVRQMIGLDENVRKHLEVPEGTVREYGLLEGDMVRFGSGFDEVVSINGYTDLKAIKHRPRLVQDLPSAYAEKRMPIESVRLPPPKKEGEPDLNLIIRACSIIAPPPEGGIHLFAAPPETGKSTAMRAYLWALLLSLKEIKNLHVIALLTGERAQDATEMERIFEIAVGPEEKDRAELYLAPAGDKRTDPRAGHYWLTKVLKARSERLCEGTRDEGRRVVFLVDSMSRVMMSHSASEQIEKSADLGSLSQGLAQDSLNDVLDLLAVAGNFGDGRTLTVVPTMLKEHMQLKKRRRSAEHVLFDQSGPAISIGQWAFADLPDEDVRPSIDLDLSSTRERYRISSKGQSEERRFVVDGKGRERGAAERALKKLINYASENDVYEETDFYLQSDKKAQVVA